VYEFYDQFQLKNNECFNLIRSYWFYSLINNITRTYIIFIVSQIIHLVQRTV